MNKNNTPCKPSLVVNAFLCANSMKEIVACNSYETFFGGGNFKHLTQFHSNIKQDLLWTF